MNNKRIGIAGYLIGDNTFGVNLDYMEFMSRFGHPVVITPQDVINPPELDLLILPGGPDILPTNYGAIPSYKIGKPSPILEHFDATILPQYMERKTPLFGICRGMQLMFTKYGGELIQHNPYHEQSKYNDDQCHDIVFINNYDKEFDSKIDKVTSRHHQSCSAVNGIPDELEVIAYSGNRKENKINKRVIEIFRHKEYPMICVQYHPENHDGTDKLSPQFMQSLLEKQG